MIAASFLSAARSSTGPRHRGSSLRGLDQSRLQRATIIVIEESSRRLLESRQPHELEKPALPYPGGRWRWIEYHTE